MSGTSLDGLDIAFCEFIHEEGEWKFNILETTSITYPDDLKNVLQHAIQLQATDLLKLNNSYGTWVGEHCKLFIKEQQLEVDFITSHGHTIHHQPKKGFTYQIGSGQHLANAAGCKVICDFRTGDVALEGQGAPLVPIGDALLFNNYDFCLNLGGISNVSFEKQRERIAFDIGLANMPLNYIIQKIGKAYDEQGNMARGGKLLPLLYDLLNSLEYYKLPYPKSTGYEWFSEKVIPLIETTKATTKDLLHTFVQHNAHQIAKIINDEANGIASVLITGGGAKNSFFTETLQQQLNDEIKVVIPNEELIDFKEALVFGLMGVLRIRKEVNCLASVTGASRDSSSGVIFLPQ